MAGLKDILPYLQKVRPSGKGYTALCPAHPDKNASFSIREENGKVLVHCFAGCKQEDVLNAVKALVPNGVGGNDSSPVKRTIATYDYTDAYGHVLFQKRRHPNKPDGSKDFSIWQPDGRGWKRGLEGVKERPLYRLHELIVAREVIFTEGEKDADRVRALGLADSEGRPIAVTTNFGGAGEWSDEYGRYFIGKKVIRLVDNDDVGIAASEKCARTLHEHKALGIKVILLPDLPAHGDVTDWLDQGHTREELIEVIRQAPAWQPKGPDENEWRIVFHTYEESINAPPLRFAIEGFLQEDGITYVGALPGHGKTMVMLNMVRSLLVGTPLFGYESFQVKRSSERVIYLIPESGQAPFVHRLKLFGLLEYVRDSRLLYRTLSAKEQITGLTDPRILKAAEGADIYLDTAIRFMEGDENSASDSRIFAASLFRLQAVGARTIVGAHHSPKNQGRANFLTLENVLRGSGDIGAMICTCWGLSQTDPVNNEIAIKNVKPRDFQPCEEFRITGRPWLDTQQYFQITGLPGHVAPYNPQEERGKKGGRPQPAPGNIAEAVRRVNAGETLEAVAKKLGVSKATIHNWTTKGKAE
jgi:hypothetical protein